MTWFLADYGQWILAATGASSVIFVIAATFFELGGHRLHPLKSVRLKFFRWWRHELTAAQVLLDVGLGIVLLPSTLYVFFHVIVLARTSSSSLSLWYYAIGLTYVTAVNLWRTDAIMRTKSRQRHEVRDEEEEHPPESTPSS